MIILLSENDEVFICAVVLSRVLKVYFLVESLSSHSHISYPARIGCGGESCFCAYGRGGKTAALFASEEMR